MRKQNDKTAARQKRDGHPRNNRRRATKRRPRRADGGDRRRDVRPDFEQDARWEQFVEAASAMFGPTADLAVLERLREQFDEGTVGPEMLRALRFLASDGSRHDRLMPIDLEEFAAQAAGINEQVPFSLAEVGRWLVDADADANHDPARAIIEFAEALEWAKGRPDEVRALISEIDEEPRFAAIAAWPRLAHVLAHYGPGALEAYPLDYDHLWSRARVELRERPTLVPPAVYDLLDLRADDREPEDIAAYGAWHHRMALGAVAQHLADLIFAPGRKARGPRDGATNESSIGLASVPSRDSDGHVLQHTAIARRTDEGRTA